jgi:hypothetical protein
MIANDTATIYNKGASQFISGITVPGTLGIGAVIACQIQPYSKALLMKQYGYDVEVNKRVFIPQFYPEINVGTVLRYIDDYDNTIDLTVDVIPWDKGYMELIGLSIEVVS